MTAEFDDLYREVILDHYKNPHNYGLLEEIGFEGRGCAISQAATSMLTDLVKGKTAAEVASLPKEEILDEVGIPLTPVRMKCAILGLGVVKVALNRSKGTPLPEEWQGLDFE